MTSPSELEFSAEALTLVTEGSRDFQQLREDCYRLSLPTSGVQVEVDRLRRERGGKLIGELAVHCGEPSAKTYNGVLSIADMNLSDARSRQERAKLCAARAGRSQVDWHGLIEEFCQRVLTADREGSPAVELRTQDRRTAGDIHEIEGIAIPLSHPTIVFGDGGSAKSLLALWLAGRMMQQGAKAILFDWEMEAPDHRSRLGDLFGEESMPGVLYTRCTKPLVYEADRLKRIVRENNIDYGIFDSVAYASDGPPEDAEVVGRYFRAVREIGVGSMHIAHVTKAEGADKRPFGSAFWHNSARMTWNVKAEECGPHSLMLALFNRKSNLGRRLREVAFLAEFGPDRVSFSRADVSNTGLAEHVPVEQRMETALQNGALSIEKLAVEVETGVEAVRKIAKSRRMFVVFDGRVGLRAQGEA